MMTIEEYYNYGYNIIEEYVSNIEGWDSNIGLWWVGVNGLKYKLYEATPTEHEHIVITTYDDFDYDNIPIGDEITLVVNFGDFEVFSKYINETSKNVKFTLSSDYHTEEIGSKKEYKEFIEAMLKDIFE